MQNVKNLKHEKKITKIKKNVDKKKKKTIMSDKKALFKKKKKKKLFSFRDSNGIIFCICNM